MHRVKIPPNVVLTKEMCQEANLGDEQVEIGLVGFLKGVARKHDPFKAAEMADHYDRLMTVLEGHNGMDHLEFGGPEFVHLRTGVKNTSCATADINRAYRPFYSAIREAEVVLEPDDGAGSAK